MPVVYAELRRLAAHYLRGERPGQTLQPTALVHEAYLRLLKDRPERWQNRAHFSRDRGARDAADPDRARPRARRAEARRRRSRASPSTRGCTAAAPERSFDMVALDAALDRLAALDAGQARIVELRFFGGLSIEETAEADGHLARHGEAPLGARPRLAGARAGGARSDRLGAGSARCSTRRSRSMRPGGSACSRARRPREPAVAAEVRALLRAHDTSGGFLESPAWAVAPELLREPARGRRAHRPRASARTTSARKSAAAAWASSTPRDDARLGRTVALKMLPPAFSRDPLARERLRARPAPRRRSRIRRIATVYALEEIDGELFIASELVRGSTLRAELAAGPLARDALLDTLTPDRRGARRRAPPGHRAPRSEAGERAARRATAG